MTAPSQADLPAEPPVGVSLELHDKAHRYVLPFRLPRDAKARLTPAVPVYPRDAPNKFPNVRRADSGAGSARRILVADHGGGRCHRSRRPGQACRTPPAKSSAEPEIKDLILLITLRAGGWLGSNGRENNDARARSLTPIRLAAWAG